MTAAAHGGEIVAEAIRAHGVTTVFTLIGGHVSPVLTAAEALGLRVVDVRDEVTAAFAADAYARLSGVPGVAVVTAGPGVTNAITALKNAQLAQSPLVLIGGATATILKGRGALQDIDQRALVTPHVKWAAFVSRVADLRAAVMRAFREAASGVPGPVFVECPVDLLYPEAVVREMFLAGMKPPRSLGERAVQWYLKRHLAKVFAPRGAPPASATMVRAEPMHVSPLSLEPIRRAITRSRRPVLVAGSQVVAAGADVPAVARAIDAIGVPVYLSGMARGLLGADHRLQFRHKRREALREADLVMLCGTPCDFRLDYGRHVSRGATLVAINRSRDDVKKNRTPTIATVAPPDRVLALLAERMPAPPDRTSWFTMLQGREAARDAEVEARAAAAVARGLNPLAVCRAIDRALPPDTVLVADGGDFVATASYIVRPRSPLSWLDPGVFGTLGVGAGFVLGAHAARPSALVVAIYGDGAFGFSLAEIDTWVKRRIPVVAIVGNDGKWAQIARDQVTLLGSAVATDLGQTAYHTVAEGFGAKGLLASEPGHLEAALGEAFATARSGRPVIVNVHIGDTDFRQGSMSL